LEFFAIPVLSLFAVVTLALPNDLDAHAVEARLDCSQISPARNRDDVIGQTHCCCGGSQVEKFDLYICPDANATIVTPCVFRFFSNYIAMSSTLSN
ncbi:uncharacterized protein LY79DRAFT_530971, partial [Colletotrichum navitas]